VDSPVSVTQRPADGDGSLFKSARGDRDIQVALSGNFAILQAKLERSPKINRYERTSMRLDTSRANSRTRISKVLPAVSRASRQIGIDYLASP